MSDEITVEASSVGRGVWFDGPSRKSWSPASSLSYGLAYAAEHSFAVHPSDAWPNPADEDRKHICPPIRRKRKKQQGKPALAAGGATSRSETERRSSSVADNSKIEWTDATWSVTRGCTKVSPGCKHCYAETFAERFRGVPGHSYEHGFDFRLVPEALGIPLKWKRPRRIFVDSMSDLFHESVPNDYLADVFEVMAQCPLHTFQCLTKRPERAREWFGWIEEHALIGVPSAGIWPLPNVWLGTSVERDDYLDRIQTLRWTPAAVRFLSLEPLLGPLHDINLRGISWVIVGGESGPGARPMSLSWVRDIIDQCRRAGVACFVKQLGAVWAKDHGVNRKGGDMAVWPEDLRVRQMPGGVS